MAKDEQVPPVDEDSLEHLDSVRQGRPRWFVMGYRGTSILKLVVYQKGTLDKYVKLAKKIGQCTICHGMIEGRGPDIQFKLATSDGFDKEPVKPNVLKSFLEEHADYRSTPSTTASCRRRKRSSTCAGTPRAWPKRNSANRISRVR